MKKYFITSIHNVSLDSYKDGELNNVNFYTLESFINAENVKNAIQQYFENVLYYNFDFKYCDFENNQLFYSVLVDDENSQATEKQKKVWKMGKFKLYSNNITLNVCECKDINFDTENLKN